MKNYSLLTLLLFVAKSSLAVQVHAEFRGQINVDIKDVEHFRKSIDCYTLGKGDEINNFPSQNLVLNGGAQDGGAGNYSWSSAMTSPFARNIRTTNLNVTSNIISAGEAITVNLNDNYQNEDRQYKETTCGSHDGLTAPRNGSLDGKVTISYQVPDHIWALRAIRKGSGQVSLAHFHPLSGVLNTGYDDGISSDQIFWVKPGSVISQEIDIPSTVNGAGDLGTATIQFKAVGNASVDTATMQTNLSDLQGATLSRDTKESDLSHFIDESATVLHNPTSLSAVVKDIGTTRLSSLSNQLFDTANGLFTDAKLGLTTKTAAALASYQISIDLLQELRPFCEVTTVDLPLEGTTKSTLGLNVASFWLLRGLNNARDYSFSEYEKLLAQLLILEGNGVTYTQVASDLETRAKLKKSYDLLLDSPSYGVYPFHVALINVKRTIKQFGTLGTDKIKEDAMVAQLQDLDNRQQQFTTDFFDLLTKLSNGESDKVIEVTPLQKTLVGLQADQKSIVAYMTTSIRLLSFESATDSKSLVKNILVLLSNQIALFDKPLPDIPHFENIRAAYKSVNGHQDLIDKMKTCIGLGAKP